MSQISTTMRELLRKSAEFGNPFVVLFSRESILTIIHDLVGIGGEEGTLAFLIRKRMYYVDSLVSLFVDAGFSDRSK